MAKNSQKLKKISERPELEAEILLAHALKKSRAWILAYSDKTLTTNQVKVFDLLINRRLTGEPLAYILGEQEFYGLPFKVNKNVLIPRPESEKLVDLILNSVIPAQAGISPISHRTRNSRLRGHDETIIDVGTGSGALAIAIAKITNSKIFAIDISKKALAIAKQNAKLNKVDKQITFLHGNLLEPLFKNSKIKNCLKIKNCTLKIVANLPYLIPSLPNLNQQQKKALSYEPKTALFSGPDGLNYYRRLAQQIKKIRTAYPDLELTLYCEADPEQMTELKKILAPAQTTIIKDFRGLNRFLLAQF